MDREQLIKLISPHKEKLTTVKEWDAYAKVYSLPKSISIIYCLNSWNEAKKVFGLNVQRRGYTQNELEVIAKKHKDHFLTKRIWEEYAKENGLPSVQTFINSFGNWQTIKNRIGVKKVKTPTYTKEKILSILIEHGKNYNNRTQWDIYAKENKIPTYKTIKKHFTYDELMEILCRDKKCILTKEELINILKHHKNKFELANRVEWDQYASENNLPLSFTFFKVFGSWRKAKAEIIIKI